MTREIIRPLPVHPDVTTAAEMMRQIKQQIRMNFQSGGHRGAGKTAARAAEAEELLKSQSKA